MKEVREHIRNHHRGLLTLLTHIFRPCQGRTYRITVRVSVAEDKHTLSLGHNITKLRYFSL